MTGKFPLDHLRGGYPRPGGFLSSFPIKSLIKSSGSPTNRFIESGIKIPLVGEGFYDTGFYEKRIACIRNLFLFSTLRTGKPWASPWSLPWVLLLDGPHAFLWASSAPKVRDRCPVSNLGDLLHHGRGPPKRLHVRWAKERP